MVREVVVIPVVAAPPVVDGDSTVDLPVDPADLDALRAAVREGSGGQEAPAAQD